MWSCFEVAIPRSASRWGKDSLRQSSPEAASDADQEEAAGTIGATANGRKAQGGQVMTRRKGEITRADLKRLRTRLLAMRVKVGLVNLQCCCLASVGATI
jgi:hypothetical protein